MKGKWPDLQTRSPGRPFCKRLFLSPARPDWSLTFSSWSDLAVTRRLLEESLFFYSLCVRREITQHFEPCFLVYDGNKYRFYRLTELFWGMVIGSKLQRTVEQWIIAVVVVIKSYFFGFYGLSKFGRDPKFHLVPFVLQVQSFGPFPYEIIVHPFPETSGRLTMLQGNWGHIWTALLFYALIIKWNRTL